MESLDANVSLKDGDSALSWFNFHKNALLAFIWTGLAATYAWHLDYKYAFEPCDLCFWLRMLLTAICALFLFTAYTRPNFIRSIGLLATHLICLLGLGLSLYLKMMIYSATFDVVQNFGIDAQTLACMNEDWRLAGFSLPDLAIFSFLFGLVHAFVCFVHNHLD